MERVVPLKESAPRVPAPYGDHIFYYPQIDTLAKLSKDKNWKFADIRPDAIVLTLIPPGFHVNYPILIRTCRSASSQTTTR